MPQVRSRPPHADWAKHSNDLLWDLPDEVSGYFMAGDGKRE